MSDDHRIDFWAFEQWCRSAASELATFYAACTLGTRRAAGAKLEKEGQSVGRSITRLEQLLHDQLGSNTLVDPEETRRVEPTEAGKLLLRYCMEIDRLRADLFTALRTLETGNLRVAITHYAWLVYEQKLQDAYKRERIDGTLQFSDELYSQDRVWEEIEQDVVSGKMDIGIYSYPPSRRKEFPFNELTCLDWIEEEFVFVVPPSLARFAKANRFSIADLARHVPVLPRVVHYSRSLGFDRTTIIADYLRRQKVMDQFQGDWLLGVNTIAEIKEVLLERGLVSFLPWPSVEREHAEGRLIAFPLDPYMRPRTLKIITRAHDTRPAIRAFLKGADSLSGRASMKTRGRSR